MSDQTYRPTVVLDWGTTGFSAALLDESGDVSEVKTGDLGIQSVPNGEHEKVLTGELADWRARCGGLSIIASGMIGSRNGWIEMPYVPTPASAADLAAAARTIELPHGDTLTLLPGLTDRTAYPHSDVMRGEETQLAGFGLDRDIVVVLPGTHTKWAELHGGQIHRFRTFVTSEVFNTVAHHSFLMKAAKGEASATGPAFLDGVKLAMDDSGRAGGLLTRLFSLRTAWLAGELELQDMRSRLWGLVVGWEFREAREQNWFSPGDPIAVVGDDHLVDVYEVVVEAFGARLVSAGRDMAIKGAQAIFQHAAS
ncbi:2-dehydro-3-deoxygalactonokinase [Ensifer sp. 1H6]|uniref:2-dehydro-3-deoxygalactonokinase n=1 Tax=Ensifer sp. 1H6 TaxID=1911585 RepID=UPI00042ED520|nr:2-dehydro-3-deoxygalactonokinase [Ensifer sp. 1H6]AHK47247.1 2-dehydro-3-deoxygalactonokinase [Ensifer adhaerens OV14]OMQ43020.1 2-dehydro-3-deoxygalactonokinase [Ensifer sp. 1H6]